MLRGILFHDLIIQKGVTLTNSLPAVGSRYVLCGVVVLYVFLLLLHPELGPADEYAFLPTLQSGKIFPMYGKDFPYYDSTALGRFSPLAGQEYNLAALVSNTPLSYFAFNSLLLIGFSVTFVSILKRILPNQRYVYLIPLIVFLVPGFNLTFFKLLYIEKSVLFYFSVFLLSFLVYQDQRKLRYLVVSLVSANIAIYYKETAFIAIGAFAFTHLVLTWRGGEISKKILDGLLILSALLYIGIYVFNYPQPLKAEAAYVPYGGIVVVFLKNLLNYGFFSDPIVVCLLFPLLLFRVYNVCVVKRDSPHTIHDPLLVAGSAYALAYFILNIYGPYYFLPVYVFALPPIFYFLTKVMVRQIQWKIALALTVFVFLANSLPLSLHYLTYNKILPINFNQTIDFLIQDINRRYVDKRLNIFLDGVDRGTGRGVYFIFGEFIRYKGLAIDKFDFKSSHEALDPAPFIGHRSPFDSDEDIERLNARYRFAIPNFPFTIFQPGPLSEIQPGDYLIVSPHGTRSRNSSYIESLEKDYSLVFKAENWLAVPPLTLKALVKYLLIRGTFGEQRKKGLVVNENIWQWSDYYVFVKR